MSGVELRPLCVATYDVAEPMIIATGEHGTRLVTEIHSARFEGERLRASLLGSAAADWATMDADGRICVDVRMTLRTDDGATILLTYQGRGEASTAITYSGLLFETGDERYTWLTRVLCVGRATFEGSQVHYDMFEVV